MDFLGAPAARLEGVGDPSVLKFAAEQDRILVTHDYQTMPVHFAAFLLEAGQTPGVFLVKQGTNIGAVIEALLLIWAASSAEEWENRILEVPF